MLSTFFAVLRRDLLLAWRGRSDVLVTLAFFIIVVCLFPFGVGAEPNQLRAIAPGVLWVAALLACLLSLHRLFAQDYADGTLEQLLLSREPGCVVGDGQGAGVLDQHRAAGGRGGTGHGLAA